MFAIPDSSKDASSPTFSLCRGGKLSGQTFFGFPDEKLFMLKLLGYWKMIWGFWAGKQASGIVKFFGLARHQLTNVP